MSQKLRSILLISTSLFIIGCDNDTQQQDNTNKQTNNTQSSNIREIYPDQTAAGSFLAGQFAQKNSDWDNAANYFENVKNLDPSAPYMDNRIMALSMGAGHYDHAITLAEKIIKDNKNNESDKSLAIILSGLKSFKNKDYKSTLEILSHAKDDGLGSAVIPLFRAWANAGLGKTEIANILNRDAVSYQSVLIAGYNKDKNALNEIVKKIDFVQMPISIDMLEEIATIFAANGQTNTAKNIFTALREGVVSKRDIYDAKLNDLNNQKLENFKPITAKQSPQQSFADALVNVSQILDNEYQDSARIFAHMAAYLQPDDNKPLTLLAKIAAEANQNDEAISYLQRINTENDKEKATQIKRQIAFILERANKIDESIRILQDLSNNFNDIDAQIQIGDIYRNQAKFEQSLDAYNAAFKMLDNNLPPEYWGLLFSRGITYEQLKKWDLAEKDLLAALKYEPEQPYILNYLGYSWADQGVNLDLATAMLEKAVKLKPNDGAIVDSLGWVYFRIGNYERAVKILEQAIELAPTESEINDHLGDAYWRVGRKSEAKFQWHRAISFTTDKTVIDKINEKLVNGLPPIYSPIPSAKIVTK